ncbi:hypothetical protein K1T71_009429 [Dendrolimus kikuchii]|uniref:Uncharacterized protein n=1 Tax=Dendrolimus kikuchii TaxID=765133 RepID=A0ACC1CUT3_9NEOP|nr:hypothetical protein K1T71_009429 [Dendrolimus kikuchii]
MAFKSILMHIAVCCILQGSSEMVPEIVFEIVNDGMEWNLQLLNSIPERSNGVFVLVEGQPARVVVYNISNYIVGGISIKNTYTGSNIITGPMVCESGSSSKCYVQIDKIHFTMGGQWEIQLKNNWIKNYNVSAELYVYIRQSRVPRVTLGSNNVTTYIANYRIKPFDAFGCIVYNDHRFIDMTCNPSTNTDAYTIEWSTRGVKDIGAINNTYDKVSYTNNLIAENDGAYLKCNEISKYPNLYREWIIVRIFFIDNGSISVANNSNFYSAKPISDDDGEGCIKYVNCLYDPDVIKQKNKYCVNSLNTNVTPDLNIVIIPVAAVFGTVAMIVLILCIRNNKMCLKRNKNSTLSPVSYVHSSNQNQNRRSDSSDHLYVYIDVNSLPYPKDIPKSSIKPARPSNRSDNGERSTNHPNENHVVSDKTYNNPGEISAEENYYYEIEEVEDEYSYAYADRIDVLSALQSKT